MNPLSNSVYSSVFTYNPNVLTRRYRHLTTKASTEPHHITWVTLNISVFIVRFGDQARLCRLDTPTNHPRTNLPPFNKKVSWLFDELSDNNASDNGLSLSASVAVNKQILEVIPMPGNDAILVVYQINAHYNTYHVTAHSAISIRLALCIINTNQRFFEGSCLSLLYLTGSFLICRVYGS